MYKSPGQDRTGGAGHIWEGQGTGKGGWILKGEKGLREQGTPVSLWAPGEQEAVRCCVLEPGAQGREWWARRFEHRPVTGRLC